MALDINLETEIESEKEIYINFYKHRLSRAFSDLMRRKDLIEHEPELDQIGKITGVDISCLYNMETYPDEDEVEAHSSHAQNESQHHAIKEKVKSDKASIAGNLEEVLSTLNQLISKLSTIENLPSLLIPTDFDCLNSEYYFSDFNIDRGNGYMHNNFGLDLRNFKRFVENAKLNNNQTVWFRYS